jgi:hypothetical protein
MGISIKSNYITVQEANVMTKQCVCNNITLNKYMVTEINGMYFFFPSPCNEKNHNTKII